MTESEAKEMLQAKLTCMNLEDLSCIEKGCSRDCDDCEYNYAQGTSGEQKESLSVAIKLFEEIQQYRAIGTVGRFQQLTEQFKPHVTDKTSCPHRSCDKCDKYRKENEKYHEIGTVEECREARERHRAKKPNITAGKTEEDKLACCPICEGNLDWTYNGFWRKGNPKYCSNCGQSIDWSDTP